MKVPSSSSAALEDPAHYPLRGPGAGTATATRPAHRPTATVPVAADDDADARAPTNATSPCGLMTPMAECGHS